MMHLVSRPRACTTNLFVLALAFLPLGGCVTGAMSARDQALIEGRFSDLERIAEAQVATKAQPLTSTLFPLCVSYAKLKRYDKVFPCLDQLEANFARGDISNVNLDESLDSGFMKGMASMGMVMMGTAPGGQAKPGALGDSRAWPPYIRAEMLVDLGRHKEAVAEAKRAIAIAPTTGMGERQLTIYALSVLGVAEVHAGRPTDARATAQRLADVGTFYPYLLLKTDKIVGLARIHVALGDYETAYGWITQDDSSAFRAVASVATAVFVGQADLFTIQQLPKQFMRAKSALETGRIDDARKGYDVLLAHPAIADLGEYYWMLLYDRGRIAQRDGDPAKAIELFRRSIEVIEAQRATVGSEASRIGFVGNKQDAYRALIDALFTAKRFDEAFDLVERSKSRALVDMLAAKKDFSIPSGSVEQVNALLAMSTAEHQPQSGAPVGSDERARSRAVTLQARQQLRTQAPELADLVTVSALSLPAIAGLLPPGETLLEYYLDGQQLYAFVLRDGKLSAHRRPAPELGAQVAAARRAVADPSRDPLPALQVLHRELIAPLDDLLGDRLTVVPHGALHYVPWGALHDGHSFLLQQRAVRLLPAANVLPFVNKRRGAQAEGALLAFGNPDLGDARMDLPSAQAEALKVTDGRARSRAMTRRDATETALRDYGSGFRWLHFATHGEFDPADPLASGLLLAKDARHDGRVTAGELYSMKLDADLVTLSACETGVGKVSGGDDVVGLVRGFLYAGASSIVASLWQVDDAATSEIMTMFYENLERADKRDALRKAQLEMFDLKPHPFYWAAFQLTGNTR